MSSVFDQPMHYGVEDAQGHWRTQCLDPQCKCLQYLRTEGTTVCEKCGHRAVDHYEPCAMHPEEDVPQSNVSKANQPISHASRGPRTTGTLNIDSGFGSLWLYLPVLMMIAGCILATVGTILVIPLFIVCIIGYVLLCTGCLLFWCCNIRDSSFHGTADFDERELRGTIHRGSKIMICFKKENVTIPFSEISTIDVDVDDSKNTGRSICNVYLVFNTDRPRIKLFSGKRYEITDKVQNYRSLFLSV